MNESRPTANVVPTAALVAEVVKSAVCLEITAKHVECGRPATHRLSPGNTPVCGVHARAAIARGETAVEDRR